MTEKVCTKCGIKKDLSLFHNDKMNKDGKTFQCAECRKRSTKKNSIDILSIYATMTDEQIYESLGDKKKICPSCDEKKDPKEFQIDRHKKIGLFTYCRECGNSRSRVYCKENNEKQRKRYRKYINKSSKKLTYRYQQYKKGAEKRSISFNISIDEFSKFWRKNCSYCDSEIETIGLDRVNSKSGYEIDNIVPCCFDCNNLKMGRDLEDWYSKMIKILKFKGKI